MDPERVFQIIDRHNGRQGALISILEDVQTSYNYLPEAALKIVANRTGRSLVDIYGVATFYRGFSLQPRGRHLVSVCMGTACHVRGSPDVLKGFEHQLGAKAGGTTKDKEFSLSTVNCLGACALGPVAVVDGEYYRSVKERDVPGVLDRASRLNGEVAMTDDERVFGVSVSCPNCNRSLMTHEHLLDGHPMVRVTASFGRKHGWMRMSSLYGDYRIQSEYEIPQGAIIHFFCPRCHSELKSGDRAPGQGRWNSPVVLATRVQAALAGLGFLTRRDRKSRRVAPDVRTRKAMRQDD
jgi:NADH-quinone oxidoreductase subunit E